MELFLIILCFVAVMTICFMIGEGLDPRLGGTFVRQKPQEDDETEQAPEQPLGDAAEDTEDEPKQEAVTEESASPQEDEADEAEDEVIYCNGEVLESHEEMAEKIVGFAKECAENIARTIGANFVDVSAYVVEANEDEDKEKD